MERIFLKNKSGKIITAQKDRRNFMSQRLVIIMKSSFCEKKVGE